jgi:hypothetical protein
MEIHLASCIACRNELKELRLVSELLQADPVPEFTPAGHFVSQLILGLPRPRLESGLPRRSLPAQSQKPGSLAWWLVPAGLLGALFFVQTVFTLTNVVTVANMTGLLGQAAGWLGGGQETLWFSTLSSLSGVQAAGALPTLSILNNVSVLGAGLLSGFLWQAFIIVLFWGWLFFWWFQRRPWPGKMQNAS